MAPRVSVVIKSYNHAAFVAQAITSVLDQSFQDFEIVVTDDASTDGTADIVRGFDEARISLEVFAENRGISAAMNATLARARGEFIAIVNSDDYALPGRLERQVAFLDAHPEVGAVFTTARMVDETGAPAVSHFDIRAPLALPDFSRRSWLRQFFFGGNILCGPTAMIRRSVYERVGDYDPRLTNLQDFDMWIRVAAITAIHVMDEDLTAFRIRNDQQNASAPRSDNSMRSQFEYAHILGRYRALPREVLVETFADDLKDKGIDSDDGPDIWLAELALTVPSSWHRLFALETLFETARSDAQVRKLREILGRTDVFGMVQAHQQEARIAQLGDTVAWHQRELGLTAARVLELDAEKSHAARQMLALNETIAELRSAIADMQIAITAREIRIGELQHDAARSEESLRERDARVAQLRDQVASYRRDLGNANTRAATLDAALSQRVREAIALKDTIAELQSALTTRDARIDDLQRRTAEVEVSLRQLFASRSWRYTAPLRRLLRALSRRG